MTDLIQFATTPEKALQEFLNKGYFIEHNVWAAEDIKRINEEALLILDGRDSLYPPLMQPHRISKLFERCLSNVKIIEIMVRILGRPLSALQSEYFFVAPGTKGFARHQDDFQVEAGPDVFASVWSSLTEVDSSNGGLIVYPGSHRSGLFPVRNLYHADVRGQDPNAYNEECIVPDEYVAHSVELPPGASVILHSHVVHASHHNISNRFREALLTTYIRSGSRFRPGNTAKRSEVPIEIS